MHSSITALALMAVKVAAAQTYTCPAQNNTLITDSNGIKYIIGCGDDTSSTSVSSAGAANSFNDCFAACDAFSGCTAFTFLGPSGASTGTTGGGTCYLKNSTGENFSGRNTQDVAGLVYGPSYYYIGFPSPNYVCPTNNNTVVYDSNNTAWALMCNSDTNTGSASAAAAAYSFDDCFVYCQRYSGCTGFTYSGQTYGAGTGTCYLQTGATELFANSDTNHVAAIKLANYGGTKPSTTLTFQTGGPSITTYSYSSSATSTSSAASTTSSSSSVSTTSSTSATSSSTSTTSSPSSTSSTTSSSATTSSATSSSATSSSATTSSATTSSTTASSTTGSTSSSTITSSAVYVTSAIPVVTVTTTKGIVVTYTAYYTTVVRKRDMSYSTSTIGMA